MHSLKPQCIVLAKAPEVEEIKFRNSDYTATQVRKMALDVMGCLRKEGCFGRVSRWG